MKKIASILLALLSFTSAFAVGGDREVVLVSYDSIATLVKEKPEAVRALTARFMDADTTLTPSEVAVVYYGHAFSPGYNPDETWPDIEEAIGNSDVNLATTLTEQALRTNPVSLPLLFNLYGLCRVSNVPRIQMRAADIQRQILMLGDMITSTGNGVLPVAPWLVISEGDMDQLLKKYIQVQSELGRSDLDDVKAVKVRLNGVADDVILYFDLMLANNARKALKK